MNEIITLLILLTLGLTIILNTLIYLIQDEIEYRHYLKDRR